MRIPVTAVALDAVRLIGAILAEATSTEVDVAAAALDYLEHLPLADPVAVALDAVVVLISTVLVPVATTERDLVASQLLHPEALPA